MDKKPEKLVPEVRFKGFTDDWEQRKLLKVCKKEDNKRIPIKEHERKEGNTPYFGANGIQGYIDGYTHDGTNILIAEDGANNVRNYPIKLITGKIWVNNHAHVLKVNTKTNNGNFLVGAIKKINFYRYLVGSSRYKLTAESLNQVKIKIAKQSEQEKIGELLKNIEELLTLYERKYQLYLLQFQKLQRVIFDNSDDFISLSYLIEIKTGNRNSQDNVKNGKYVFFDRSTEIKRLNEFDFDEEAIIIPGEGTKFAPKYINGKYALHQRSYSLYNFSQEIDSKYLYYFLMTQSNTLLRYSVGTTVPSLRVSTFDHIKVPMYSKELQIKYALTFDSLEKLMNQIKKKTNILRSLKRFLLQVLFL